MPDAAPVTMATACMYLRLSSDAAAGVTDLQHHPLAVRSACH
jgi:hypothetical protein